MIAKIKLLIIGVGVLLAVNIGFAQNNLDDSPSITQSIKSVININAITDPLRQGAQFVVQSPDGGSSVGLYKTDNVPTYKETEDNVVETIKTAVNIALGFVTLLVLLLLIIEGIKIVVAWTDTEQYKKSIRRTRNYAIAIAGIALSRLILTFIFYVIGFITS